MGKLRAPAGIGRGSDDQTWEPSSFSESTYIDVGARMFPAPFWRGRKFDWDVIVPLMTTSVPPEEIVVGEAWERGRVFVARWRTGELLLASAGAF